MEQPCKTNQSKIQLVIEGTLYTADCIDKEQLTQVLQYITNTIESATTIREAKHILQQNTDLPIQIDYLKYSV